MSELVEPVRGEIALVSRKTQRSDTENSDFLNKLTDDLLLEILLRLLPQRSSVFRCTAVCKRWNSLISAHCSEFDRRCSRRRLPYTILFQCKTIRSIRTTSNPITKKNRPLKFATYSMFYEESRSLQHYSGLRFHYLDFLPIRPKVRASFEDMLLVSRNSPTSKSYYICNPLTQKYVALPRALKATASRYGLVFKRGHGDKDKYRVVLVTNPGENDDSSDGFVAEIFCSETQRWREFCVKAPKPLRNRGGVLINVEVVACNGRLHWLDGYSWVRCIVAFDPFDDITEPKQCLYIDPPEEQMIYVCLGVCEGRLRLSNFVSEGGGYQSLRVWELMGGGDNPHSWCLKHEVCFGPRRRPAYVLAFDPNDGDVVFIFYDDYIFRHELRLKEKKKVGEFSFQWVAIRNPVYDMSVFSLVHPFWPTRVPSLVSI